MLTVMHDRQVDKEGIIPICSHLPACSQRSDSAVVMFVGATLEVLFHSICEEHSSGQQVALSMFQNRP